MTTPKTILCLALLVGSPAFADSQLDGRTYAIKFKEKRGGNATADTLLFRNGRFRSTACDAYGFADASYTTTGTKEFAVRTESAKEGRVEWHGTVRGDVVEGTFVWTKAGKPVEYTFSGSAVAATPPKGFDVKNARDHLTQHQAYPATRAELIASCKDLMDFSADDKKWFSESLPEGRYASAADVMKVLGLK
jgi:hypothetical protein